MNDIPLTRTQRRNQKRNQMRRLVEKYPEVETHAPSAELARTLSLKTKRELYNLRIDRVNLAFVTGVSMLTDLIVEQTNKGISGCELSLSRICSVAFPDQTPDIHLDVYFDIMCRLEDYFEDLQYAVHSHVPCNKDPTISIRLVWE
jgi:hypothetical protein